MLCASAVLLGYACQLLLHDAEVQLLPFLTSSTALQLLLGLSLLRRVLGKAANAGADSGLHARASGCGGCTCTDCSQACCCLLCLALWRWCLQACKSPPLLKRTRCACRRNSLYMCQSSWKQLAAETARAPSCLELAACCVCHTGTGACSCAPVVCFAYTAKHFSARASGLLGRVQTVCCTHALPLLMSPPSAPCLLVQSGSHIALKH